MRVIRNRVFYAGCLLDCQKKIVEFESSNFDNPFQISITNVVKVFYFDTKVYDWHSISMMVSEMVIHVSVVFYCLHYAVGTNISIRYYFVFLKLEFFDKIK